MRKVLITGQFKLTVIPFTVLEEDIVEQKVIYSWDSMNFLHGKTVNIKQHIINSH